MELNGDPCLDVEHVSDPRKGIMTSRSFGKAVTDYDDLSEAIAEFVSIAAEKLRAQNSVASLLHVTLRTNKYSDYKSKYKYSIEVPLHIPTANTSQKCGHICLDKLYQRDLFYKKAAVMLPVLYLIRKYNKSCSATINIHQVNKILCKRWMRLIQNMVQIQPILLQLALKNIGK